MEIPNQYIRNLYKILFTFLAILSVFFAVKVLSELKYYRTMSVGNLITFSGHGEVQAVVNIANINFTISKDAKNAKDAQAKVAETEKKALDFLKAKGVEEKDIKTENASVFPKYEYQQGVCPQIEMITSEGDGRSVASPLYCPPGKETIIGYTASESITVKVRKTDDAGALMQGLGGVGVSNLSGPNFAIENEDAFKAEARKKAIEDAKEKASTLAKDLGVRLGKISSFSEGGDYPFYEKSYMMDAAPNASAPATLPKGENTVSVDVTITYEIR